MKRQVVVAFLSFSCLSMSLITSEKRQAVVRDTSLCSFAIVYTLVICTSNEKQKQRRTYRHSKDKKFENEKRNLGSLGYSLRGRWTVRKLVAVSKEKSLTENVLEEHPA